MQHIKMSAYSSIATLLEFQRTISPAIGEVLSASQFRMELQMIQKLPFLATVNIKLVCWQNAFAFRFFGFMTTWLFLASAMGRPTLLYYSSWVFPSQHPEDISRKKCRVHSLVRFILWDCFTPFVLVKHVLL